MHLARNVTQLLMAFAVAIALSVASAAPSSAASLIGPRPNTTTLGTLTSAEIDALYPGGSTVLSPENFVLALQQLEAALPHTDASLGSLAAFTYSLDGAHITLPSASAILDSADLGALPGLGVTRPSLGGGATPDVSYRYSWGKYAFGFNTTEQQMIASGATTAIAAAVCLIPAIGWAACALIAVVVAVATTYVTRNGVCTGGRTLWWYDVAGGSVIQCRSTAPF